MTYAVGGLLLACLLLGGATRTGFLSDVFLQLAAAPLLLWALWNHLDLPRDERPRWVLALAASTAALPLLQLFPLPPLIWTALPGREMAADSLRLLDGELAWMPISVSPTATWLSALSLLPPLAIFLATSLLGFRDRRSLSLLILAMGLVGAFLGLAQVAQGPSSPLRFFSNTNLGEAVGFFANRNHFAALLYALAVFAGAWSLDKALAATSGPGLEQFDTSKLISMLGGFTLIVALLAAQIIARSRAGVGLTIIALLGIVGLALRDQRSVSGAGPVKLLLGATALAMLLLIQFALYRILDRFAFDPLVDARIAFARNTIEAAWSYMPFGAGIGTFMKVYPGFEKPKDIMANTYANHAHNDILELWLEGGLPAIVLVALCILWLTVRSAKVWRGAAFGTREIDHLLARSASLVVGLLIAHSLVDYPLRTTAIMAVLAYSCGLLTNPPPSAVRGEHVRNEARKTVADREPVPMLVPLPAGSAAWASASHQGGAHNRSEAAATSTGQRWGKHVEWPAQWRKPSSDNTPQGANKIRDAGES